MLMYYKPLKLSAKFFKEILNNLKIDKNNF